MMEERTEVALRFMLDAIKDRSTLAYETSAWPDERDIESFAHFLGRYPHATYGEYAAMTYVAHKQSILDRRTLRRQDVLDLARVCVGLRPEGYCTSKEIADALYVTGRIRPRPSGGEVGLYLRHLRRMGLVTCIENKTDRYRWMLP